MRFVEPDHLLPDQKFHDFTHRSPTTLVYEPLMLFTKKVPMPEWHKRRPCRRARRFGCTLDFTVGQGLEEHVGANGVRKKGFAGQAAYAPAGEHLVPAAAQALQHLPRLRLGPRFPRIRPATTTIVSAPITQLSDSGGRPPGFGFGQGAHVIRRIAAGMEVSSNSLGMTLNFTPALASR